MTAMREMSMLLRRDPMERLRRAYRRVALLEADLYKRHGSLPEEAAKLRVDFATQTVRMVDGAWRQNGMSRAARRAMKRRLVEAAARGN
jgi:hypothetical protein